jgi:hypothetical protein
MILRHLRSCGDSSTLQSPRPSDDRGRCRKGFGCNGTRVRGELVPGADWARRNARRPALPGALRPVVWRRDNRCGGRNVEFMLACARLAFRGQAQTSAARRSGRAQYEVWKYTDLIIDVAAQRGEMFIVAYMIISPLARRAVTGLCWLVALMAGLLGLSAGSPRYRALRSCFALPSEPSWGDMSSGMNSNPASAGNGDC